MRNKKIENLLKEVDVKVRLQVYKNTLNFIKGKYEAEDWITGDIPEYTDGLCLLLPVILWNLKKYSDKTPNKKSWDYNDTSIAFPELTNKVIRSINSVSNKVEQRIEFLENFITKLSSKR